jgi:hypothetical protein
MEKVKSSFLIIPENSTMMGNGRMVSCKARDFSSGPILSMKVSSSRVKEKVMGNLHSKMEIIIRGIGLMENKKVLESYMINKSMY